MLTCKGNSYSNCIEDYKYVIPNDIKYLNKINQLTINNREKYLNAILETTSDCIKVISHDGMLLTMNTAGLNLIEADTQESVLGQSVYPIIAPEYRELFSRFNERICSGESGSLEFEIIGLKGTRRWMETHAVPFRFEQESETFQLAFSREITLRKKNEKALIASETKFRTLYETTSDAVMLLSCYHFIDCNLATLHMFGCSSRDEFYKKHPGDLSPTTQPCGTNSRELANQRIANAIQNGTEHFEWLHKRIDTEQLFFADVLLTVMSFNGEEIIQAVVRNITDIKYHQSQLEHLAHYDSLTKLPNRVLLEDRLHQSIIRNDRNNKLVAVAYIDLDGFKSVNDNYGHDIGDDLLVEISHRMLNTLREVDTLARIGGDEFVAILSDLEHMNSCHLILKRILHTVSEPITIGNHVLHVSASIGITIYPHDYSNTDQLMRHADQAMYSAKQAGKNQYCFFDIDSYCKNEVRHKNLVNISQAFDLNEFVLFYQPKVNIDTGQVIGVEALIRWIDSERGLLLPNMFLPIIENTDIEIRLDDFVIDKALEQLINWQNIGINTEISINLTCNYLQSENFMEKVQLKLLNYPEFRPYSLQIEILENNALKDANKIIEIIKKCDDIGISFGLPT